jgi:hypothetical protein
MPLGSHSHYQFEKESQRRYQAVKLANLGNAAKKFEGKLQTHTNKNKLS